MKMKSGTQTVFLTWIIEMEKVAPDVAASPDVPSTCDFNLVTWVSGYCMLSMHHALTPSNSNKDAN